MANIPLSPGETFVLSKKNNTTYIKSSTDSAEQQLIIRNNIQVTGSAGKGTTIYNSGYIELTTSGVSLDSYIAFKPSTVTLQNFALGYDDSANRFSLCTGTALSTNTNRQIFHVHSGSRILHVDEGLTVTGSLDIADTVRYRGEIYSEFTFTAAGNYTAGTWYNVVNSDQLVEGMYIIQGFVTTYNAGSYIYDHKFASVPFYWYDAAGTNDTTLTNLPAVIGSGHAIGAIALPTFRLKLTNSNVDGKLYLQFNPGVNWTGINSTGGKTFYVHLKRIG